MTAPSPRPEVLRIHPYVAGESVIEGANRTLKLSSNEGAFGVPPGAKAAIAGAIDEIEMATQSGEHPRIGAVDVVPFVPLGTTRMAECVELARTFGARVAERFGIPVDRKSTRLNSSH